MPPSSRVPTSFSDLEHWLDERRVTEIECLVPDLTGVARGKILPREKFTEDRGMRLPEAIVAIGVTGEFPAEGPYYDVITPTDRDMHLQPDPRTVRIVPWASDPTAQVVHDCYDRDGHLIPYAPRSVLKRVCQLYADQGWSPVVAPELEFYLIERSIDPNMPLRPPRGRSGRAETSRQAYSIDAVNEFDPLFEDIYAYCEQMELNVDTLIHEVGAGQMEINFFHDHPLGLADEVFFFKRTIREAALRHEMYATFMAKPMANEPGSAMHIHQSVERVDNGENIFSNPDGSPSKAFYWFIGGLQRYAPAAMALFAPYVNSYRRLVRSNAAPINIQWGHRQPHRGHPRTGGHARFAPHREPHHRGRCQPLRGPGRHAGLRLPGHDKADRAHARMPGRCLPGRFPAAAQPGRGRGPAARRGRSGADPGAGLHHRLLRDQGRGTCRVHEGDLAVGARAPAAACLTHRGITKRSMETA